MHERFKTLKRDTVLLSIIFTALGLLFLLAPDTSGYIICYIVGGVLCAFGVLRGITHFVGKTAEMFGSYGLVQGLALLIVGVSALVSPGWLEDLLPYMFGLVLIVDGAFKLQHAVDLIRLHAGCWWGVLITAVAVIAVGVVTFFDPFVASSTRMMFIGACLIANGVSDLIVILHVSGCLRRQNSDDVDLSVDVDEE